MSSEADLCIRVRDWLERRGFQVFPEVGGWDLVAVATEPRRMEDYDRREIPAGHQVGVHAKMRANCDVLAQAMGGAFSGARPWKPFVAVPSPGQAFVSVARRLDLGVIDASPERRRRRRYRRARAVDDRPGDPEVLSWPDWVEREGRQLALPPIASRAIVAGSPSPRTLSEWRVSALRFLIWARKRESYASADVVKFGLHRTWGERWGIYLRHEPRQNRAGRSYNCPVYRLRTDEGILPDAGYEDVLAELEAAGG